MAKKWQSRFIHSEKRIKKHFQRFLCDWENIEPPHGKKALNTQAKRDLAIGGYDKVRLWDSPAQGSTDSLMEFSNLFWSWSGPVRKVHFLSVLVRFPDRLVLVRRSLARDDVLWFIFFLVSSIGWTSTNNAWLAKSFEHLSSSVSRWASRRIWIFKNKRMVWRTFSKIYWSYWTMNRTCYLESYSKF